MTAAKRSTLLHAMTKKMLSNFVVCIPNHSTSRSKTLALCILLLPTLRTGSQFHLRLPYCNRRQRLLIFLHISLQRLPVMLHHTSQHPRYRPGNDDLFLTLQPINIFESDLCECRVVALCQG